MACNHKFSNDLLIEYANWEVHTLFIGTFNPGWKSKNNNADWFYGRTSKNEFWCILPKIHKEKNLLNGNRNVWIDFCKMNKIAITDILISLDNADEDNFIHQKSINGFKDDELDKFTITINPVVKILEKHLSIKQICITRQTLPAFWKECFKETFEWIDKHPERNIAVRFLRSPSRGARKGIVGNFCDFVADRWLQQDYQII